MMSGISEIHVIRGPINPTMHMRGPLVSNQSIVLLPLRLRVSKRVCVAKGTEGPVSFALSGRIALSHYNSTWSRSRKQ